MKNFFIVDDHPMIAEGLIKVINDIMPQNHCQCFYRGEEALLAAKKNKVDFLITDLALPDIEGNDLIRKIRLIHPKIKTMVICTYDQTWRLKELFGLNINGMVFKTCPVDQHATAISEIVIGNDYYSPLAKERIISVSQNSNHIKLTKREREVLKLLQDGMKTKEISSLLGISENTIETYRRSLLKKLGAQNTAGMISKAIDMGIVK